MKALNEKRFMVAIHQNLIESFPIHQHNNFIVLDLACENVKPALKQVKLAAIKKIIVSGNCFQLSRLSRDAERVTPPSSLLQAFNSEIQLMYRKIIVGLTGYLA